MMRTQPRKRTPVRRLVLVGARPVLRYSASRDAFVLRGIGNRHGPVLVDNRRPQPSQAG
jgi:hypothetical protein